MSEIKWVSSALYTTTDLSVNAADSSATITPAIAECDCKALRFVFDYTLNPSLYLSNYDPKILIRVEVAYKGESIEKDYFFIVVSRESKEAIVELKGQTIDVIKVQVINNSTSTIDFSKFEIYESEDVSPIQIGRLFETDAIQARVIKTSSFFTEAGFIQKLLTNAMSRSVRSNAKPGDQVDYILIEGWEIGFYTAILGAETEQFTFTTQIAGVPTTHEYWYQVIEGDLAYIPITDIHPKEFYPDISDSDVEKFKFMVYKPASLSKKMSIEFAEDEVGALTPTMIFGAGTDPTGQTHNGKGFIYKNSNGFYHIYQQSNGNTVGIVMDETGVHITGWTDQHLEKITFKDNGVKLKFTGEDEHSYEYVYDDSGNLTGLIQDAAFLTKISYEAGTV